jgi:hypothetical protein
VPDGSRGLKKEIGLCLLLMDASGSMNDKAFPGSDPTERTRVQIVAGAAAAGIFELKNITKPESAYLCIIMFDDKPKQILFNSIQNIYSQFGTNKTLADFLIQEMIGLQGSTDINGALRLANNIVDQFLDGSLPNFTDYTPLVHKDMISYKNEIGENVRTELSIPNVRVFIYTDGEQTTNEALINPFQDTEPDILIGAFIGRATDKGYSAFESIFSNCPRHHIKQFFLLDRPDKVATLRNIFRMASGASGFCPKCAEIDKR